VPTADLSYQAFISYSHADEAWARWLHRAVETYRVPRRLIADRPDLPARLVPIFRDRDELPTAVDLGQKIEEALRASRRMIVVCSPSAARSRWVNEEIRRFKALGGTERVFAIIVDGEPNARERGYDASLECFPEELRIAHGAKTQEHIAADVRAQGDGRRNAQLKLIAGMLGVGLDDLKRRDQQRRQRRLVAVTIASVSGLVLTSALAAFAWVARSDAEREAQTSKRTTEFMVQLFDVVDPGEARGRSVTAYEILEKGVAQIHRLNDAPDVQATLLETMGKVFTGLGLYQRSVGLLEEALQTAGNDVTARNASTLVALGDALYMHGDYDAAESRYRAVADAPNLQSWSAPKSDAVVGLADVATQRADYAGAIVLYRRALDLDVATWGGGDAHAARSAWGLGQALMYAGDYAGAEASLRQSIVAYRTALGPDHPRIADTINDLGTLRYLSGDIAGAADYYYEALPLFRKVYGNDHPNVAGILNNLGRIELERRRIAVALPLLEESVAIERRLNRADHDDFVFALNSLGLAYRATGDAVKAEELLQEAEKLAARHDHRMWGPILVNEADLRCAAGRVDGTAALLDEAATKIRATYPEDPWRMAILDSVRGECLSRAGETQAAEHLLLESLPVIEKRWGRDALFTYDARARVAAHYDRVGHPSAAKRYRSP
jgi:tetratricopeptide (TPR) repeat protein